MLLRIEIKATEESDWISEDTVIIAKVQDYSSSPEYEQWRLQSIPDFVEDATESRDAVLGKWKNGILRLSFSVKENGQNGQDDLTGVDFEVHRVSVVTDFPIP